MNPFLAFIKNLFKAKNLELTTEEEAQLSEAVKSLEPKPPTPPVPPAPANPQTGLPQGFDLTEYKHNVKAMEEMKKQIEEVTESNKMLQKNAEDLIKLLGDERTARENGQKVIEERQATERKASIENIIKAAIDSNQIPSQNEDLKKHYTKMLETDFETTKMIIDALPKITPGTPAPAAQGKPNLDGKLDVSGMSRIAGGVPDAIKQHVLAANEITPKN